MVLCCVAGRRTNLVEVLAVGAWLREPERDLAKLGERVTFRYILGLPLVSGKENVGEAG
jgi:hypothetical protein